MVCLHDQWCPFRCAAEWRVTVGKRVVPHHRETGVRFTLCVMSVRHVSVFMGVMFVVVFRERRLPTFLSSDCEIAKVRLAPSRA